MLKHAAPSTKPKNNSSERTSFARAVRSSILPMARQVRNVNAAAKRILATCIRLSFLETDGIQVDAHGGIKSAAPGLTDVARDLDAAPLHDRPLRYGPAVLR